LNVIDDDIISLTMFGSGSVSLGLTRWDMKTSTLPKAVWNTRLNILSPEFASHIYTNPYTGNIYVSYINNNDGTSNLALLSQDGKLRDAAIAQVDNRFRMGFQKDKMVMIGTRQKDGLWQVILVKRKDGDKLASCFLVKKAFSTSTFNTTSTQVSMSDRSVTYKSSTPNPSISAVEFKTKCLCSTYDILVDQGKDSMCLGDSSKLVASGGSQYRWLPANGLSPEQYDQSSVVVYPTETTTYDVVIFSCECPGDTLRITIYVAPPEGKLLGNDTMICSGDTLKLTAPEQWLNYSWGPNFRMTDYANYSKGVYPDIDTFYYVSALTKQGCVLSDSIYVSIDPCCERKAIIGIENSLMCWGDDPVITNKSPNKPGLIHRWYFPDATNGVNFVGYNPPIPKYAKGGDYLIRLIVESNCGFDTAETYISLLTFVVDAGNDTSVCAGDSVQIGLPEISNYTYSWAPLAGLSDAMLSNPKVLVAGFKTYTLTVIDEVSGCTAVDSLSVDIYENDGAILSADTTLCIGQMMTINLPQGVTDLLWHNGSIDSTFTLNGDTLIWVSGSINQCFFRDTMLIDYITKPTIDLPTDTAFCKGLSVELNVSYPEASYLWYYNNSTNPIESINAVGQYVVQVTNICGSVVDSVYVNIEDCDCYPFIPNAFTPNQDKLNESFGSNLSCELINYQLQIFNRWGELIFISQDPSTNWTGEYQGETVTSGIYFWILKYTPTESLLNKETHLNGTVRVFN
jgi:gliding motility-associated-like protein